MSHAKIEMSMRSSKGQDIRDRTFRFGVRIVKLSNRLPRTAAGFKLADQVIRSGTSVGANVEEADAAESKKDFIHKMKLALKEAQETRYWLRIIIASEILTDPEMLGLQEEIDQLIRIINVIISHTSKSMIE